MKSMLKKSQKMPEEIDISVNIIRNTLIKTLKFRIKRIVRFLFSDYSLLQCQKHGGKTQKWQTSSSKTSILTMVSK